MRGMHRLLAAALLALATSAGPAVANKVIIPNNGSESFPEMVQIFRTSAMHQPTFNTKHRCSLAHECATVEFAVGRKGTGRISSFIPTALPKTSFGASPARTTRTFAIARRRGLSRARSSRGLRLGSRSRASIARYRTEVALMIQIARGSSARNTTLTKITSRASCISSTLRRRPTVKERQA
jgi:hypothetical protein